MTPSLPNLSARCTTYDGTTVYGSGINVNTLTMWIENRIATSLDLHRKLLQCLVNGVWRCLAMRELSVLLDMHYMNPDGMDWGSDFRGLVQTYGSEFQTHKRCTTVHVTRPALIIDLIEKFHQPHVDGTTYLRAFRDVSMASWPQSHAPKRSDVHYVEGLAEYRAFCSLETASLYARLVSREETFKLDRCIFEEEFGKIGVEVQG